MPFDPKLIHEDDANFEGDLQLPDDLALMGQQLGDDAARLAASYPPPVLATLAVSRQELIPTSRYLSWVVRSLVGTALATGLVTISLVALNSNQLPNANYEVPAAATPSPAAGALVIQVAPANRNDRSSVPVTPASWLSDTSGPELEALMDLWEQDQPAIRSLSF
jgi:hypothetical protein